MDADGGRTARDSCWNSGLEISKGDLADIFNYKITQCCCSRC